MPSFTASSAAGRHYQHISHHHPVSGGGNGVSSRQSQGYPYNSLPAPAAGGGGVGGDRQQGATTPSYTTSYAMKGQQLSNGSSLQQSPIKGGSSTNVTSSFQQHNNTMNNNGPMSSANNGNRGRSTSTFNATATAAAANTHNSNSNGSQHHANGNGHRRRKGSQHHNGNHYNTSRYPHHQQHHNGGGGGVEIPLPRSQQSKLDDKSYLDLLRRQSKSLPCLLSGALVGIMTSLRHNPSTLPSMNVTPQHKPASVMMAAAGGTMGGGGGGGHQGLLKPISLGPSEEQVRKSNKFGKEGGGVENGGRGSGVGSVPEPLELGTPAHGSFDANTNTDATIATLVTHLVTAASAPAASKEPSTAAVQPNTNVATNINAHNTRSLISPNTLSMNSAATFGVPTKKTAPPEGEKDDASISCPAAAGANTNSSQHETSIKTSGGETETASTPTDGPSSPLPSVGGSAEKSLTFAKTAVLAEGGGVGGSEGIVHNVLRALPSAPRDASSSATPHSGSPQSFEESNGFRGGSVSSAVARRVGGGAVSGEDSRSISPLPTGGSSVGGGASSFGVSPMLYHPSPSSRPAMVPCSSSAVHTLMRTIEGHLAAALPLLCDYVPELVTPIVVVGALRYLAVAQSLNIGRVEGDNWFRLFFTALMVSSKMHLDLRRRINKVFADALSITVKEMNTLEVELLYMLDFNLLLCENEYTDYAEWLLDIGFLEGKEEFTVQWLTTLEDHARKASRHHPPLMGTPTHGPSRSTPLTPNAFGIGAAGGGRLSRLGSVATSPCLAAGGQPFWATHSLPPMELTPTEHSPACGFDKKGTPLSGTPLHSPAPVGGYHQQARGDGVSVRGSPQKTFAAYQMTSATTSHLDNFVSSTPRLFSARTPHHYPANPCGASSPLSSHMNGGAHMFSGESPFTIAGHPDPFPQEFHDPLRAINDTPQHGGDDMRLLNSASDDDDDKPLAPPALVMDIMTPPACTIAEGSPEGEEAYARRDPFRNHHSPPFGGGDGPCAKPVPCSPPPPPTSTRGSDHSKRPSGLSALSVSRPSSATIGPAESNALLNALISEKIPQPMLPPPAATIAAKDECSKGSDASSCFLRPPSPRRYRDPTAAYQGQGDSHGMVMRPPPSFDYGHQIDNGGNSRGGGGERDRIIVASRVLRESGGGNGQRRGFFSKTSFADTKVSVGGVGEAKAQTDSMNTHATVANAASAAEAPPPPSGLKSTPPPQPQMPPRRTLGLAGDGGGGGGVRKSASYQILDQLSSSKHHHKGKDSEGEDEDEAIERVVDHVLPSGGSDRWKDTRTSATDAHQYVTGGGGVASATKGGLPSLKLPPADGEERGNEASSHNKDSAQQQASLISPAYAPPPMLRQNTASPPQSPLNPTATASFINFLKQHVESDNKASPASQPPNVVSSSLRSLALGGGDSAANRTKTQTVSKEEGDSSGRGASCGKDAMLLEMPLHRPPREEWSRAGGVRGGGGEQRMGAVAGLGMGGAAVVGRGFRAPLNSEGRIGTSGRGFFAKGDAPPATVAAAAADSSGLMTAVDADKSDAPPHFPSSMTQRSAPEQ